MTLREKVHHQIELHLEDWKQHACQNRKMAAESILVLVEAEYRPLLEQAREALANIENDDESIPDKVWLLRCAALAAVEAELVLANNTMTDCETRMADIVAERDDLRRKLADAEHDCDEWRKQADIQLTGTASLALANAALRTAYDKYIVVLGEGISEFAGLAYVHGCIQSPELVERGNRCREEIAAFSADGLAEEVVKYMRHDATCDKASNLSPYTPCTCGLDALLDHIGGKP